MKMKTLIVALCLSLFSLSCNYDDNVVDPYSTNNLIANYSFEKNGSASLEGWTPMINDTNLVNYSKDVPPNGGKYSLRLTSIWTFAGYVKYEVPQQIGVNIYKLSAFVKCIPSPGSHFISDASFGFFVMKTDSTSTYPSRMNFIDSTWTMRSFVDTIQINAGEKLYLFLHGSPTQWSDGYAMFDLLKLEIQN